MANKYQITWAQSVRDMVIASMSRGQLPVLGGMFIFGLIVWKMPSEDISKLTFKIFENIINLQLLSFILLLIALPLYFFHVRFIRKEHSKELERMGNEKSELQSLLVEGKFKSSNRK